MPQRGWDAGLRGGGRRNSARDGGHADVLDPHRYQPVHALAEGCGGVLVGVQVVARQLHRARGGVSLS